MVDVENSKRSKCILEIISNDSWVSVTVSACAQAGQLVHVRSYGSWVSVAVQVVR